jgi:hypothetical protein
MTSGADEDPLYQSGVDHVVFHDFTVDGGIQDDVVSQPVVVVVLGSSKSGRFSDVRSLVRSTLSLTSNE